MYKILLVDDEQEILNGYATLYPWKQFGFDVAGTALNYENALYFLKYNPVDVLICDIVMPGQDGLALAAAAAKQCPNIKIIVLSGHSSFEYARKAIVQNIRAYVLKSDKHAVLFDALRRIKNELDATEKPETTGTIELVVQYIRKNYSTANLAEAAALVHMNMYYLSRLFKEKKGENFFCVLLRERTQRAKHLLEHTELNIYDIAEQVGYSDAKNFTRIFKKNTGFLPKDYRQSKRTAHES